jgi:hypothetical protein
LLQLMCLYLHRGFASALQHVSSLVLTVAATASTCTSHVQSIILNQLFAAPGNSPMASRAYLIQAQGMRLRTQLRRRRPESYNSFARRSFSSSPSLHRTAARMSLPPSLPPRPWVRFFWSRPAECCSLSAGQGSITVSSNKISLVTVIVNNKNNSKTSNKQQKRKVIGEKCYWNQP